MSIASFLPEHRHAVLDIGCNIGLALRWAREHGYSRFYGIDINAEAIDQARIELSDLGESATVFQGSGDEIPIGDASVDLILCQEVLEHVPAELRPGVVSEMVRVLKPGGRLILTVPYNGLFAFLDPENMRFRIPGLYRLANRLVGGRGKDSGYDGQKHGVVWHHHFQKAELEALFGPSFKIQRLRGRGCFLFPICLWLQWPLYRWKMYDHPLCRLIEKLKLLDLGIPWPLPLAFDVLMVADRPADT